LPGSLKKGRKALKKTRGRPKAEIDLRQLERLCELQCTQEELATFFRVSTKTNRRVAAQSSRGGA